jgi:hypothetical protein
MYIKNTNNMIIIGIITVLIGFILLAIAFRNSDYDLGIVGTIYIISTAIVAVTLYSINSLRSPKAIDVYRGKTTLQITYKGNIPIDTTVVYK